MLRCSIVGSGDQEPELLARRARLGLEEVVSMPGPMPQRDVVELVRDATVFAAPCVEGDDGNRDGLPTVLLEAMALGTPCVSTAVTGIPEVVRHEETGLIARERDPESLADSIERLLGDRMLRASLARDARRLMEADFDIHRNAARLRGVFEEAVSSLKEAV